MATQRKLNLPEVEPWMFIIGSMVGLSLWRHHAEVNPELATGEPQKAIVNLIILVVVVALTLLASYLIAKKNKATLKDDKPTTLVTRGSFINWVLGVRRVGPLFCWAGDRRFHEESSGKKGGSGAKVKIWNEAGWHLLCIGPAFCLHRILNNGEAIFQGPISRLTHPSGAFVDLGSEGGFFIFWGEPTQPPNTFLGDPDRVGITSRWPYHCYVVWADKRLGQSANWPLLDYEMEVRIESTNLVNSDPHIAPTETFITTPPNNVGVIIVVNTAGSTDYFELDPAFGHPGLTLFKPKSTARLIDNTGCPGTVDFEVAFRLEAPILAGFHPVTGAPIFEQRDQIHFASGTLAGCTADGTLISSIVDLNFGVNAAHAIDNILHASWPRGLGFPTSGTFSWIDMDSLEALGTLFGPGQENLRCSFVAVDGDDVRTVLGTALQDLGVMMPMNIDTGLIEFVPIREPAGTLPRIRDDLIVDRLPEIEVLHGFRPADRITFSFPDRNLTDRDGTIAVMDDGQILMGLELQRARRVQIVVTTDFATASAIAQRRSQEELAGGSVVTMTCNRGTRRLMPGQQITVDALPEIMVVTTVKLNTEDNRVVLELMTDFYGVPKSPFIDDAPPTTGGIQQVEPDIQKAIVEVSEYLLGAEPQSVVIARLRAHSQIFQADLHISGDNISYIAQGAEFDLMAGGTLDEPLPAANTGGQGNAPGGLMLTEVGPEFEALGPDIGVVLDLSSDLPNWRLGRQVVIINSLAGQEVCFLRNVTAIIGSTWRLDGLLRGRFETRALDHPVGAEVYIFETDDPLVIQDPLLVPEVILYAKTQPQAGGILPLSADLAVATTLYGKAAAGRPVPAGGLTVVTPDLVNVYQAGDDVGVRWDYGTPQSPAAGAGLQGAGNAVSFPPIDGDFVLEIRDAGGTVIERTEALTTNSYVYDNADINSDHGGEPTFQVWVYQRRGGLLSDPVKLTVEKI